MNEVSRENQPTYEELLEFWKRHMAWQQEHRVLATRRMAATEECRANLTRTWTGRLVLLVRELDFDWVAVFAFAVLASVNFWIVFGVLCAVRKP